MTKCCLVVLIRQLSTKGTGPHKNVPVISLQLHNVQASAPAQYSMQQLQHALPQLSAVLECQGGGRRMGQACQNSAVAVLQLQRCMAACQAAVLPADQ